jgi:sugar transferase (PEP-CTERM system associated)
MATVRVFNHHLHSSFYWLVAVDALLFVLAFYAGTYLYFLPQPGGFQNYLDQVPIRAGMFAAINVLCLGAMGLYEPRMREGASGILLRTIGGFLAAGMIMAAIFYVLPDLHMWRGIYFYAAATAFAVNLLSRSAVTSVAGREQFKNRVLVYGSGQAAATITNTMRRNSDRKGFTLVGFVRVGGEDPQVEGERIINLRQSLSDYTRQTEIDQIVIALDDKREALPMDDLFACRLKGVEVFDLVNFFEREAGKILVDHATPGWMSFTDGFKRSASSRIAKRWFDVTASVVLLLAAWPFMLLTALAIWLEDGFGSPVLFRQERVGRHGKTFDVLKFRSMTVDAEGDGKARWATKNDSRVTRVGNFIRKTRIDELPQILNVLAGDMAFIGPRPERPQFVKELTERIPYYHARHCVKPGITGWAQLCYPYGASEKDARHKLEFDLYYVKNHSLFLDFMICLTTVEVVLFGKGAR